MNARVITKASFPNNSNIFISVLTSTGLKAQTVELNERGVWPLSELLADMGGVYE